MTGSQGKPQRKVLHQDLRPKLSTVNGTPFSVSTVAENQDNTNSCPGSAVLKSSDLGKSEPSKRYTDSYVVDGQQPSTSRHGSTRKRRRISKS